MTGDAEVDEAVAGQPDRQTILIVDDEPPMRLLVRTVLEPDDYTIVEAVDGEEGWELCQQHQPAVVVLDINMPKRSGIDLARAIKDTPALHRTRIVFLTGFMHPVDISEGRRAGADLYLAKPFSPLVLRAAIAQTLQHYLADPPDHPAG
jgi:CheY-like chemotaxis protein